MKKALVILSARLVSEEIQGELGSIPACLTPYENVTILEGVTRANEDNFDVKVATYEGSDQIKEIVKNKNLNIEVVELSYLGKLIDTIKQVDVTGYDQVTYILGDTCVKGWKLDKYVGDKIAYSHVEESEKWTTFSNENGELEIFNKESRELSDFYNAFIGVYSFANTKMSTELVNSAANLDEVIKSYNEQIKLEFIEEENWIDLGHNVNYKENVLKNVEARYFNEIKIDREKGMLTKRSIEKEKFTNEIKWYLKLPKSLEHYSPRIFSYDLSYENLYVTMEYYAYTTLHQVFVHGNYSVKKWNKILNLLINTNKEFEKYSLSLPKAEIDESLNKIYLGKTLDRFEALKKEEAVTSFFEGEIKINGKTYPNLTTISEVLPALIEEKLLNIDKLSIIHGDYFFANILYYGQMNFIRLIDPRGDFGGFGIYGDSRYDLAKLSHSINGKYDFIVSDEFTLNEGENEINYTINSKPEHEEIKDLFFKKLGDSLDEIRLIESLLFLSMVPLHSDYPNRQKVMLARGLELIMPFIEGEK